MIILTTPVLLPVIRQIGVDPIHYGVILAINTMIGTITPPVGTLMFVSCRIAGCSIAEFTKTAWPYIVLLISVLMVLTFVPSITLWLPNTFMP